MPRAVLVFAAVIIHSNGTIRSTTSSFAHLLLAAALLLQASPVFAQQGRLWRIGVLETTPKAQNATNLDALRKGLAEFGYVEGKNLVIHYRSADGRAERFPELANELVLEKVDLIVTRGTAAARAATNATRTIPIVAAVIGNPASSNLVRSLAHPGGNFTGLSAAGPDLAGKRVELIKELLPRTTRIGVLSNMTNPSNQQIWLETERAARTAGIQSQLLDVRKAEDLQPAIEAARGARVGALVVTTDTLTQINQRKIADLAAKARLPTVASNSAFVAAGFLISYGPNTPALYHRSATYVDKIFKGANAGDLPIEEPAILQLAINLATAKELGVVIPPAMRFRADKLVE